jgi:hypothetical protein
MRDYDDLLETRPSGTLPNTGQDGVISFQVWDWDDDLYTMTLFTLEKQNSYQVTHRQVVSRAYRREDITNIFKKSGFSDVTWIMPEVYGYVAPIMIARK